MLLRSLLFGGAALLSAFSGPIVRADSSVTIDLSGVEIKSGKPPTVYSANSIDASTVYDYEITGTVHGTGILASYVPSGTQLSDVLETLGVKNPDAFLSGRLYNPGGKLPFTVVSVTKRGHFKYGVFTVSGVVSLRAGITTDGLCGFKTKLLGFSFFTGGSPTLVFDSGSQIAVNVDTDADPDLYMTSATGKVIGKGTAGGSLNLKLAPGKSVTIPVTIQNDSSQADTFTLSVPTLATGFSQTVTVKGSSTALLDSSTTSAALPSLPTLKTTKLLWTITNDSATSGATTSSTLTATSGNDSSKTDTLDLGITAK
ncbi:MAG: hypothetical protein QM796_08325 [Chthoniobacteraceae bacterium]